MKNTGKYTIYNIAISDDHINNGEPVKITSKLSPGKKIIYETDDYIITSSDLTKGSVTNIAYATGTYNDKTVKSNEATATVTAVQNPALALEKSAFPATYDAIGTTITYTYKVTNSGNVDISEPITVTDNILGTVSIPITTSLAPGNSVTGTATYKITQDDLNSGSVTNTAYATFTYNGKEVKSNEATATVTATQSTPPDTQIPEFPSMALPVAAIIGLLFISQRGRKDR